MSPVKSNASFERSLEQLKEHFGARTDRELAEAIGLKRTAIVQWRKRGAVPSKHVLAIFDAVGRETLSNYLDQLIGELFLELYEICRDEVTIGDPRKTRAWWASRMVIMFTRLRELWSGLDREKLDTAFDLARMHAISTDTFQFIDRIDTVNIPLPG